MTVTSVSNLSQTLATSSVSASSTAASTDVSALLGDGTTTDLSGPARWMSELKSLAESDPTKFKEVTAAISSKLKEASSQASGSEADALSSLADKFSQASSSGSLDALRPDGPPPGPPPDASGDDGSSSSGAASTTSTDGSASQKVKKYAHHHAQSTPTSGDDLRSRIDQLIQGVLDGTSTTKNASSATTSSGTSST